MLEITFTVTPQEADMIGGALGKMPYEMSWQLIQKLHMQFQNQNKPEVTPNPEGEENGQ